MRSLHTILAIDIGAGTQDILLYDATLTPENCISMILPTPTRRYVHMIERCNNHLFITGDSIGGGGMLNALKAHLARGFRVTMSEEAAYTLRNSIQQVMDHGITIDDHAADERGMTATMHLHEFEWTFLKKFLSFFEEVENLDLVAVGVQDHGVPPDSISNRVFRFKMIEQQLRQDNRLKAFVYTLDDIPFCYKRMKAVARRACLQSNCEVVAMDTCFAAILGCLEEKRSAIAVNVGNSHTIAAIVSDGAITSLMEHHTGCLTTEKLDALLMRFMSSDITSEEVLNDGGHGAAILFPGRMKMNHQIIVTGPNRDLLKKSRLHVNFAAPHGNMMLTGSFGLVKGAYLKYADS